MDENNVKLLIFCRGEEQLKTSKRKTWSRSKNSRLPVAVNVTVYLSIIFWGYGIGYVTRDVSQRRF